jgi:flagellar hook assembly protein FlgD
VLLSIHDAAGRLLRDLVQVDQEAGPHAVVWNGCDGEGRPLASGVYFARLEAAGTAASCKLVLLK